MEIHLRQGGCITAVLQPLYLLNCCLARDMMKAKPLVLLLN